MPYRSQPDHPRRSDRDPRADRAARDPGEPGPHRGRSARRPAHLVHREVPAHHAVPGVGQARAYWVDETTLAWPPEMLPQGVRPEDCAGPYGGPPHSAVPVSFGLVTSPDGSARLDHGMLRRGDRDAEFPLRLNGRLPDDILVAHPQLRGYLALTTLDEFSAPRLVREDVEVLLTGQLAVIQRTAGPSGGWVTAFTAVQTWPLIDRLWGRRASVRDGSAPLGAVFPDRLSSVLRTAGGSEGSHSPGGTGGPCVASGTAHGAAAGPLIPSFAIWAPTAREVTLLAWPTDDPTGSAPLIDGEPVRLPARRRDDGRWVVASEDAAASGLGPGVQYLWEVMVYVPETGRVEINRVTDPCSRALTLDSRRSVAVDLNQRALKPSSWCENLSPDVVSDAARAIYELHVRDFSAADTTVPEDLRGTYAAFGVASNGTRHMRELAAAGIDTVHILPVFDFASVPEDREDQTVPDVPAGTSAASRRPQAAVCAAADTDAYDWGYAPWHWMAPEGSYARAGHQDGGRRVRELRDMVGALHGMGLQVVLDQVYNHTAAAGQDPRSVLDRIVPGYYHRLDATGRIETSACGANVATERAMAERLMIDACVGWVRDYRVDGLRLDLMGYHSVETLGRLRRALEEVAHDAIGHEAYLYGEGWDMGEVAGNALFRQAIQGQVGADGDLHVGTFNDRVRDAILGGSLVGDDPRIGQGYGTGAITDPSGLDERSIDEQRRDLGWRSDIVRLSLSGNLRSAELLASDGRWVRGEWLRYGSVPAAYGDEPVDSLAYVDAHDDETLFDRLAYKLPVDTPMSERVRAHLVCLAAITLGQTPCFWAAGTELLRSKSLDTDSHNSGDWFNAIDWTGQDNRWGRGLPPAGRNFDRWVVQAELLVREDLRPSPADIARAKAGALDLLRLRRSSPLLNLGSAELVGQRVSFPVSGPEAQPGLIIMVIDDGAGSEDLDPGLDGVVVALNTSPLELTQRVELLVGRLFTLSPVQAEGVDDVVRSTRFDPATGMLTVPGRTAAVLVEH